MKIGGPNGLAHGLPVDACNSPWSLHQKTLTHNPKRACLELGGIVEVGGADGLAHGVPVAARSSPGLLPPFTSLNQKPYTQFARALSLAALWK